MVIKDVYIDYVEDKIVSIDLRLKDKHFVYALDKALELMK